MNKSMRSLAVLAACVASIGSAGCSWFGLGREDANAQTKPQPNSTVYAPPIKADPNRTGDFRRDGVLSSAGTPAPTRTPAASNRPLVMLPPSTRPVTNGAQAAPEYLVLGSIVANVNGSPIYGHELMKQVAPLLRARAKELDEARFRRLAQTELDRQRRTLISDELTYAAAQRNTTQDEAREAQQRTFFQREQMISRAGGSAEMARQLAREQGEDFDELLKREERRQLVMIYYRKRIIPRVAVTVDEMRRHYEQHRESQFTVAPQATIRMIRIDLKEVGSESAALDRINDARRRALAGEKFEALAEELNRMPLLVQNKGLIGPLSKGSYVIAAVDEAIWTTPVGKVSPVIRTPEAFYLFQVVEREEGRTRAFDEAAVQKEIQGALSSQKQQEITRRNNEALQKDAVIQADEAMLQPVVEMAMQMYPEWRGGA